MIHFIGGAGFGSYPRVAYSQLLERLASRAGGGVAVVACPVDAGLDHASLAAGCARTFAAVVAARAEAGLWPGVDRLRWCVESPASASLR